MCFRKGNTACVFDGADDTMRCYQPAADSEQPLHHFLSPLFQNISFQSPINKETNTNKQIKQNSDMPSKGEEKIGSCWNGGIIFSRCERTSWQYSGDGSGQ